MKALLLVWLCIFITAHETSTLRAQIEPTGVARVYGYARYSESGGRVGYIRRARAELWEDAFIDARLAISQTDDYGYYEFNVAMTLFCRRGFNRIYWKIVRENAENLNLGELVGVVIDAETGEVLDTWRKSR